jgi:hypothetical protein
MTDDITATCVATDVEGSGGFWCEVALSQEGIEPEENSAFQGYSQHTQIITQRTQFH